MPNIASFNNFWVVNQLKKFLPQVLKWQAFRTYNITLYEDNILILPLILCQYNFLAIKIKWILFIVIFCDSFFDKALDNF